MFYRRIIYNHVINSRGSFKLHVEQHLSIFKHKIRVRFRHSLFNIAYRVRNYMNVIAVCIIRTIIGRWAEWLWHSSARCRNCIWIPDNSWMIALLMMFFWGVMIGCFLTNGSQIMRIPDQVLLPVPWHWKQIRTRRYHQRRIDFTGLLVLLKWKKLKFYSISIM